MNVDRFLAWFYRAQERRSSPRSASLEAQHHASAEEAERSQDRYAHAVRLLGRVDLTGEQRAVLRAYYLGLANHHCAYIVGRNFGEREVSRVMVEPGTAAIDDPRLEVADMVSFANWRGIAAQTGVGSDGRARRLWHSGRRVVAEALPDEV